jgi:hypothetical protein
VQPTTTDLTETGYKLIPRRGILPPGRPARVDHREESLFAFVEEPLSKNAIAESCDCFIDTDIVAVDDRDWSW